jgi:hypothetical protein
MWDIAEFYRKLCLKRGRLVYGEPSVTCDHVYVREQDRETESLTFAEAADRIRVEPGARAAHLWVHLWSLREQLRPYEKEVRCLVPAVRSLDADPKDLAWLILADYLDDKGVEHRLRDILAGRA